MASGRKTTKLCCCGNMHTLLGILRRSIHDYMLSTNKHSNAMYGHEMLFLTSSAFPIITCMSFELIVLKRSGVEEKLTLPHYLIQ
jgi:hypothetical protein